MQKRHNRENQVSKSIPSRKWRKLYKCKKGKGDHAFEIVYASQLPDWWYDNKNIMVYKECTACGKQDVEFIV